MKLTKMKIQTNLNFKNKFRANIHKFPYFHEDLIRELNGRKYLISKEI